LHAEAEGVRLFLQEMAEDIPFEELPPNWTSFDLKTFSAMKELWDFQRESIENAIKVLWKYYEDFVDYQAVERDDVNHQRKRALFQWYKDNGMTEDLDIYLKHVHGRIRRLLGDYYPIEDDRVPYEHFINRMCFWMATGSGKTLVIIKLIEVLWQLVQRGEIPPNDILVLTHRDDLIDQLKRFVNEFNSARVNFAIRLRELKEYPDVKRTSPSLFGERGITVFYYRSDNLSDEQKERIVDFRNYDNGGKWYIMLDEAHKGDREESKRQHIYSILSRNGFLFNFSATFIDQRDFVTTVFNFNLSEFIRAGYGKHVAILKQEMRAFREGEDYSGREKKKLVLKSLLVLAYVRKFFERVRRVSRTPLYHRPLLLTLVNSVNIKDADLKLFFRELERIGRGEIDDETWQQAKSELWNELKERPGFVFENGAGVEVERRDFQSLSKEDILRWVYNSPGWGEIEVLVRPSNRQEMAFKLKTADRPFALIKIGDISEWLKNELAGYWISERFEDESYFKGLNREDSEINILMGSRTFYEGWDSNRPNVINFINIGMGEDAKKFVLQSVGRGVRIQPLGDKRKRLLSLYNSKEVNEELFHRIKEIVPPLETLFIFGTNRNALHGVIEHLDRERREKGHRLSLYVNEVAGRRKLLVPVYRDAGIRLAERRPLAKFEVAEDEFKLIRKYIEYIGDDRVLLALYDVEPSRIRLLKESLNEPTDYYRWSTRNFKNIEVLLRQMFEYFSVTPKELEKLKDLEEEIQHFRNIRVLLRDVSELQRKIDAVRQYKDPVSIEKELDRGLKAGEITLEQYKEEIKRIARTAREETFEREGRRIRIKNIANHYYVPIILSEDEKAHYIKHIIKTESEVKFINALEEYSGKDNTLGGFDWWMFSKLDQSLDEVHIPYYNPKTNRVCRFKPDFVFWLQKGNNYFIVFIDPKSINFTDYEHKVGGYKELFEDDHGHPKAIDHEGMCVRVFLFLRTEDRNRVQDEFRGYWFDDVGEVFSRIKYYLAGDKKRSSNFITSFSPQR